MSIIEPHVVAEHANQDVEETGGQVRERPQVSPRGGARGPEAVACKSTRDTEDNLGMIQSSRLLEFAIHICTNTWLTSTCFETFQSLTKSRGAFFVGWILYLARNFG